MAVVPELLAPAGDWEALRAAVANGADAVYFGVGGFNARHRATNFSRDELPTVFDYLHRHNVRGYAALNILVFSDELGDAAACVRALAAAGADGVIVQDLGLAWLIHRLAPGLAVHGSTQMTLTEPRGIELVRSLGVQRVILARELSLADVAAIRQGTDLPVEVFVHGALCVAYSGQCLTSESLGGRSANRGQCAQACRLPYELIVDGRKRDLGDAAYLLSPQDLAAHDLVADLARLGVCALKIEGRLKSAHYVAAATQTYRAALDAAAGERPFTISDQQRSDLAQSFSRGFTHGFLDGVNHQALVHGRFPKSRGLRLGTVAGLTAQGVVLELDCPSAAGDGGQALKPGDGVVFDQGHPEQWEQGGRIFAVRPVREATPRPDRRAPGRRVPAGRPPAVPHPPDGPRRVELVFGRGDVNLAAVAVGSLVWKTDDPAVRRRLEQSFARDRVMRREAVALRVRARVGHPLEATLTDAAGRSVTVHGADPLPRAVKHPLTVAALREQFGRLGDTPFELGPVTLSGDDGAGDAQPVMAPRSVLNDLRREAVRGLLGLRAAAAPLSEPDALEHLRREIAADVTRHDRPGALPAFHVLVRTMPQLEAALAWRPLEGCPPLGVVYGDFEDLRRCALAVERARQAGRRIGLATLRVLKPGEEGLLNLIGRAQPDLVLVRNLGALSFFRQRFPDLPLVGDYALNVANEITAHLFRQRGLQRVTPSYDLSWSQLAAMLGRCDPAEFEVVIHQHMPMFHMEHCVFAHMLSEGKDHRDCGRPCDRHRLELRDRVGVEHPLVADAGCRNTLFNATAQSAAEYVPRMKALGLGHFRVELLREKAEEVTPLLDRYARVLAGLDDGRATYRQMRVLSQLGVTRGTLEE